MTDQLHILSTLDDEAEARRRRHALAQRRYRKRLKRRRAPNGEDLGRAMLDGLRTAMEPGVQGEDQNAYTRLIEAVVDQLVAKGFNRGEVRRRLMRALVPIP